MKIQYDTPFEVTENQYHKLMNLLSGYVAGLEKDGKYFIKLWIMSHRKYVRAIIAATV